LNIDLVAYFKDKLIQNPVNFKVENERYQRQTIEVVVVAATAFCRSVATTFRFNATIITSMNLQYIKKIVSHNDIFKRLANKLELEAFDPAQPIQP